MSTQSRASRLTVTACGPHIAVIWTTYLSVVLQCSVRVVSCRVTQAASALQEQRKNNSCLTGTAQHETALAVQSFVRAVCLASIYIEIS